MWVSEYSGLNWILIYAHDMMLVGTVWIPVTVIPSMMVERNPGCQVTVVTEFVMLAPIICGT